MGDHATNPGPLDASVLHGQANHVSAAVWEWEERGELACYEHTSMLNRWVLNDRQQELVNRAGFGYLSSIPAITGNAPLVSALVERWRSETNTFHMTMGEMTVTLEDVAHLLGLRIDGEPVIGHSFDTCDSICLVYLGKEPGPSPANAVRGKVSLNWLLQSFSHCPEDATPLAIVEHTRAYLLFLVGTTLFTSPGRLVSVMYVQLFADFNEAGRYAWGAAALAYLYRSLGNASVRFQKSMAVCLPLLQCWSYYRLNVGRPENLGDPVQERFPLALRWIGAGQPADHDVAFYREALDYLKPSDVEWRPYANINRTVIPDSIFDQLILGRSKTMLICFDRAERHLPDRCLRQFGMHQMIPEKVIPWSRLIHRLNSDAAISEKMGSKLGEWANRRSSIIEEAEGVNDEGEYENWYSIITRRIIGRPCLSTAEFQRVNVALMDVANAVDELDLKTHEMNPLQLQIVTRIKNIVQKAFKDRSDVPPPKRLKK